MLQESHYSPANKKIGLSTRFRKWKCYHERKLNPPPIDNNPVRHTSDQ